MSGSEYANANVYVSFIVNFNGVDDYNIIYCVFRGEYANVNINLNGVDNQDIIQCVFCGEFVNVNFNGVDE